MSEVLLLDAIGRSAELVAILDTMPSCSAQDDQEEQDSCPADQLLIKMEEILRDEGYPTTSLELDSIVLHQIDDGVEPDEVALQATLLLRAIHRTINAYRSGDIEKYGYLTGQLMRAAVSAERFRMAPFTIAGLKCYTGGKRGAQERSRIVANGEIITYCITLLKHGREPHEITGLAHARFSGKDGFPSKIRQYSTITKSLREFIKQKQQSPP